MNEFMKIGTRITFEYDGWYTEYTIGDFAIVKDSDGKVSVEIRLMKDDGKCDAFPIEMFVDGVIQKIICPM